MTNVTPVYCFSSRADPVHRGDTRGDRPGVLPETGESPGLVAYDPALMFWIAPVDKETVQRNNQGRSIRAGSDVDCRGDKGDGPRFVRGPITITGSDPYRLDGSDNDGIGCEGPR